MSIQVKNCPGSLKEGFSTYSGAVLKRMFENKKVHHILPFSSPDTEGPQQEKFIENRKRISISGVQEKLSIILIKNKLQLTEPGQQGQYILKPIPRDILKVSQVPANEHLTMQIARQVYNIPTAENALIFFDNGKPAYITKRFDLKPGEGKYLQEDFAAIAGKTKDNAGEDFKYEYNYLDLGKLIAKHINAAEVELEKYYKLVLFNYLFSNGDAHLKNFSLIESTDGDFIMSPAYDLVCTRIHVNDSFMALKEGLTEDSFEHPSFSALGYFAYDDFFDFGLRLDLKEIRIKKIIDQLRTENNTVYNLVAHSFLDNETKQKYAELYKEKLVRLNISFSKRI
ncbi:MAG: HipA domain-containing protein [Bacteroidota bacterium]|nr:HipA domain-containing protein [Bacteroidota bacterium]